MDHAAWLQGDDGEDTQQKYQYFMRTDPDQRDFLGPKETEWDELTKTEVTFRHAKVGMVRGAAEENMKPVKVYLGFNGEPSLPHIRIDAAQQLRGWYQSAQETRPGSRARPCYTEAVLTEPYGGFCTVGCAFSSPSGVLVKTPEGYTPIQELKKGDLIWGRTALGLAKVAISAVTRHWKPEGYVIVKMEGGSSFRVTHDHPVYSVTRGWVEAGSLTNGEGVEVFNPAQPVHHVWGTKDLPRGLLRSLSEARMATVLSRQAPSPSERTEGLCDLRGTQDTPSHGPEVLRRVQATGSGGSERVHEGESEGDVGHREVACRAGGPNEGEHLRRRSLAPSVRGDEETQLRQDDGEQAIESQDARRYSRASSVHERSGSDRRDESPDVGGMVQEPPNAEAQEPVRIRGRVLSIPVGVRSRPYADVTGAHLGLRDDDLRVEEDVVHSGLLRVRPVRETDPHHRGEGSCNGTGLPEAQSAEDGSTGGEGPHVDGAPYAAVRSLRVDQVIAAPGGLQVYDIETPTGNFFIQTENSQGGGVSDILVHNCYINSGFRGYRGSGLITVPVNYGAQLRKQLSNHRTSAAGYFSSFTDPFLPIENYYHNTRDGAMEFDRLGLPVFFLSRLSYPGWTFDLLQRNKYSYAQKSINTPHEDDWRKLSPGAASLEQHMSEIRELRKRGVYVSIQCNPVIAGITTHDDVELLFEMLAEAGASHVIIKFVEAAHSWAPAMIERMIKRFGDNRAAAFRELFMENSCGGQKTIDREYRLEGLRRYQTKAMKLGMTFSTCYEYDKGPDGKWRSIGGDWKTSDQCHGHRVPMFTRSSTQSASGKPTLFREVTECPPSGCLSCASQQPDGKPACGNEARGEARAMRAADYREPVR